MRREGNIIQEIIDHDNMSDSFDQVLRGTVRKKCREGQELLAHREEVIANLQREIADGTFTVSEYRERDIYEYGKHRRLQIVKMERRIGCHAIMQVVDRHLHRRFIRTTGASIKRRGTHDMMQQVSAALRDNPHLKYAYQFDIRHFYENVDHQLAKDAYAPMSSRTKSCFRYWAVSSTSWSRASASDFAPRKPQATSSSPSISTIL